MISLRQALRDYLAVRRALGYKLERHEKLLTRFLTYIESRGERRITIEAAFAWATLSPGADRSWVAARLSVVRQFARHLHAIDPDTEVPPANLLPGRSRRATPYLYSDDEIAALMAAAARLATPYRAATYRTLIGLLAVTGIRVGEAINLNRNDLDAANGLLTVRIGKFEKSRALPLHATSVDALAEYLHRSDRPRRGQGISSPLFLSRCGTRLFYSVVGHTFRQLVRQAGLSPRSALCRPRLHDLRHSFAVRTVLDGYRDGGNPGRRLALLSTYLGHVDPSSTYWYLSAAPELLALAGKRLERYLGGGL